MAPQMKCAKCGEYHLVFSFIGIDDMCPKCIRAEMKQLRAEITRIQSSLTLSREEGRREGREEAAKMVDAECARVLATQTGKVDSFSMAVDQNVRMIALLMPNIAAAIRSEAKGERRQE